MIWARIMNTDQKQSLNTDGTLSPAQHRHYTNPRGWFGIDLDGTLAIYTGWVAPDHIGEPVLAMQMRVCAMIKGGAKVKIFTARVGRGQPKGYVVRARKAIREWTKRHLGKSLQATCMKDLNMIELWDDRAVCVQRNTGQVLGANELPDLKLDSNLHEEVRKLREDARVGKS